MYSSSSSTSSSTSSSRPFHSHILVFFFLSFGLLFSILSVALNLWAHGETEDGAFHLDFGLWKICGNYPGIDGCSDISQGDLTRAIRWSQDLDEKHQAQEILASRAFLVTAILIGFAALGFAIFNRFISSGGETVQSTRYLIYLLFSIFLFELLGFSIAFDGLVIGGAPTPVTFQNPNLGYQPGSSVPLSIISWLTYLFIALFQWREMKKIENSDSMTETSPLVV